MSDIKFRKGDVYKYTVKDPALCDTYFSDEGLDKVGQEFLVEIDDINITQYINTYTYTSIDVVLVKEIGNKRLEQQVPVGWLAPFTDDDE